MAALVPTMDQVLNATVSELMGASLPGPIAHYEDRLPNEWEAIRPLVDVSGTADMWWIDAVRRPFQGPATGEIYGIYDVVVRYVCTRADGEEEWSRQARFNLELAATEIEDNDAIFAIGSQQPMYTPKTTEHSGDFVRREGSKYWAGSVKFSVEARRGW